MINKKQLDYFILKEASKFLKEDLQSDILAINDEFDEKDEKAKENLDSTNKSIEKNKVGKTYHNTMLSKEVDNIAKAKWQNMIKSDDKKAKDLMAKLNDAKDRVNELKKDRAEQISGAKKRDSDAKRAEAEGANDNSNSSVGSVTINLGENMEKQIQTQPKKKDLIVRFDKNTTSPFTVKFTDRGFMVGNTRMSFETIERAISKEFSITLKTGLILTPVKMQKILKYKNRY
jgi:hypothetical protein